MLRAAQLERAVPGSARRRVGLLAGCALMLCLVPPSARAQSEDQIKAAFLFNFARYVEWPATAFTSPDEPIRICMIGAGIGAGAFADVVSRTVSGKQVENRPVEAREMADLSGISRCHILYVGDGLESSDAEVVSKVASSSVFTVADRAGFALGGGVANFIRSENKIRFEINPNAARKAGLKVSSRLLRLARLVE